MAKSFFNDTFELWQGDTNITINDKNIAWDSDRAFKFKNLNRPDWRDIQWIDVED